MTADSNQSAYQTSQPLPLDFLVYAFLASRAPIRKLQDRAELILSSSYQDLSEVLRELPPREKDRFISLLFQLYRTVDVQEKRFLDLFGSFCNAIKQLPPSASISAGLEKRGVIPVTSGCLTDIWHGHFRNNRVAVKAYRTYPARDDILWRRAPTWKKFSHPHLSVFHGVATKISPLALVYDWEVNGDIIHYVRSHPQPPRLALLLQVACGLDYLHSLDIVHGGLRGTNVLIDRSGRVRLTHYGLGPFHADLNLAQTIGISKWLAPEIIRGDVTESKPADCYSFGMVIIEVFTCKPPFGNSSGAGLLPEILKGYRPELPLGAEAIGLTEQVETLLRRCWHNDPGRRPTANELVRSCKGLNNPLTVPQPTPPLGTAGGQPTHPVTSRATKGWRRLFCGVV